MKNIKPDFFSHILVALLLAIYIAITPNFDLFFYDGKRIAEISLVLLTFITLSASGTIQNSYITSVLSTNPVNFALLLLIMLLGSLSALLSLAPDQALIEIISMLSMLLVSYLCAQTWRLFPDAIPWLISALLLSFVMQEIKFFSYYAAFILTKSSFSFYDFFFTFAHPRFFNQYQLWTLPLLSFVLLIDHPLVKKTWLRFALWGIAIAWWGMFFTTNGRGVLVAVIASFIITSIIFRKKAQQFLTITLVLMLLGLVFYQALFQLIPYVIADESFHSVKNDSVIFGIRATSSGRLNELWPAAIDYITENPWLGIGPMHFSAWNGGQTLAHPHNSLLQLASEWGLPALVVFIFLLFKTLHAWYSRFNLHTLNNQESNLNLAIMAVTFSLSSALIYSLFSGVFIMPMSHLMAMLVISFAFAIYQNNNTLISIPNPKHNWAVTAFFATCAIGYFWLLSPELIPRLMDPSFHSDNILNVNAPRFWLYW